jgi:CheY-like chemotaxis protein
MARNKDVQMLTRPTGSLTRKFGASRASILIVDDEPAFCGVLSELLRSYGYAVRYAHSVTQAWALIEQDLPDLVLTDVMMPDVDGLSLVRRLRSDPTFSGVAAIVVSAKAQPEDIEASINAGADGCLVKPFSARELRDMVSRVLTTLA